LKDEQIAAMLKRAILESLATLRGDAGREDDPEKIFQSPKSQTIKQEMIAAGKKLWQRQYVDGNGGNISYRISDRFVLCTPTLCSKGDLTLDDFSLVDLENVQLCGSRPQTSEIRLHLEIYKTVPEARAVIHCHPPYATAHAIAGVLPPINLIPEQEVFVGPMALSPYETPGTWEFARTVVPFVKKHNTVLLANHGIVCWADTVTHAEWYVEVADTYCKTALIASQLAPQLPEIPPDKVLDLLAIKKKLGLPDARFEDKEDAAVPGAVDSATQMAGDPPAFADRDAMPAGVEALIDRFTSEVCRALRSGQ
jgi:L-fuculose-phosphate aldolase